MRGRAVVRVILVSKFYISLEDDLMRLFGSEKLISMFNTLGIPEGQEIEHKMLTNAIENAQKKIESNNYGIRKEPVRVRSGYE